MVTTRCLCACMSLVLIFPEAVGAQEAARPGKQDGLVARIRYLVPPGVAEELNLSTEQARQVKQLEKEYRQQWRETMLKAVLKIVIIIENSGSDDESCEPAPVLAIAHEVTGTLLQLRRARVGFERKVLAVLNTEQKEKYRKLK